MHGLTFAFTLISALVPAPAGAATDAGSRVQTLTIAQATSPPPQGAVEVAPPPPTAVVAPAEGYAPPPPRGVAPEHRGLSLWGIIPYGYGAFGLGIGARFAVPLPIPSLIPGGRVRDDWSLEFGADYYRYSLGFAGSSDYAVNWFLPVCGIMWNVWLNDNFAVYPKVEAGYHIGWVSGYPDGYTAPAYGGVFASGAVGLIYKLGGTVNLRAEAGYAGIKGGVGFAF
jgi:hypothetical protein